MIIGVDARTLQEPVRTGVPIYLEQILRRLIPLAPQHEFRLFINARDASNGKWRVHLQYHNVKIIATRWPRKLLHLSMLILRQPKLEKYLGPVDVLFIPTLFFTSFRKSTKIVQTFHDLSFERYGRELSFIGRVWHKILRPHHVAERADKILAVSHSTAYELEDLYNVPAEKITVTPLAGKLSQNSTSAAKPADLTWLADGVPFFLFLGTQEPRKNVPALIEAFDLFKQQTQAPHQLVIAGSAGYSPDQAIDGVLENSPYRKEIFRLGYVTDETKAWLYQNATGLAFISLYEGFGIPLLEAFAAGIPVLTSTVSSLPEVAQKAAVLVDPWRVDQIAEGLAVLTQVGERLRERGLTRNTEFSWDKTAAQTLEVLINTGTHGTHRH